MDDKTQKERLEQELRFLKESFEAEVISKEEFEKGKDRIEKKLREIEKTAKVQIIQEKNEEPKTKPAQESPIAAEKQKTDAAILSKDGGKIKLNVIQEPDEGHEHFEMHHAAEQKEHAQPDLRIEEQKKGGKFFRYAVVFAVLILVVYFSYSLFKNKAEPQEKNEIKFVAACSSNFDCRQEGKEGICVNPDTKDAKCEFREIQKTNVLVVNDRKNCFNCDTQRVLGILEKWFGPIDYEETDYSTAKGRAMAEKFNLSLLPAYILEENITKNSGFDQFRQAFAKKDSSYVMSEDAAGSAFYFRRDNVPNKLDLFIVADDSASMKAENNLKEFLDNFKGVKFEKHFANGQLAKELNLKSFPTFLVNNRVKFSGVHTAETIKQNFCKLNKAPECEKVLSRSLV